MFTYILSYDLIRPEKNYQVIHDHLKSYPNWAKPLESVWLIKTPLNYTQLRDTIQQYMDANDKLLLIDVTKDAAAWKSLSPEISNWIKNNL